MSQFTYACPVCRQHINCSITQGGSVMECPTCFQKIVAPYPSTNPNCNLVMTGKRYAGKSAPTESKTKLPPPPLQPTQGRKTLLVPTLAAICVVAVAIGFFVFGNSFRIDQEAVLHFSFDKTSFGSVRNTGKGGRALNGGVSGRGVTIVSDGKFGKTLKLDGTGGDQADNIVLVRSSVLNTDTKGSWTVALWVKTMGSRVAFLYQGDGSWSSGGQTTWYLDAGRPSAVRYGGGWWIGATKVNDGQWHHIAYIDDAGKEILYVDGSVDRLTSHFSNPMAADANQLWIGGSPDGNDQMSKINGCIDELWMFNRALNATEVRSLMADNRIK